MSSLNHEPLNSETSEPERHEINHARVVHTPIGDVLVGGRFVINGESTYNVSTFRERLEDLV